MKVIDLLNKIANGEEAPLEIKCYNKKYRYDSLSDDYDQIGGFSSLFKDLLILNGFDNLPKCLNDEVEIIEEPKKKDLLILNGFDNLPKCLNDEVEIIEESKKIEKITLDDWVEFTTIGDKDNIDYMFNKNSRIFVNKINEIIDYIMEEKYNIDYMFNKNSRIFVNKINEIIDYIMEEK